MKYFYFIVVLLLCKSTTAQLTLQSHYDTPYPAGVALSNIWSYTSASGVNYALVGSQTGLSIVDISNPFSPNEVQAINWNNSIWREVKTKGNYAYVTTEGGGGVMIVDLSGLPASAPYTFFTDGGNLDAIHALHIEGNRLYLYGASSPLGDGALIYDITIPTAPVYLGAYNSNGYIHDGEVRNNIIYASHIYDGVASVCDLTNPAAPMVLGTVTTPTAFTHNTWLNDADQVMFTTDENDDSYIGSYDISDPTDIKELDRWQLGNAIVHNVYVLNDFLIASYYTEGIVVVDAHEPEALVMMEHYDTSPSFTGNNFNGAWGVCPYYNDSTIVASDIEEGLYVFKCGYKRAAHIKGLIKDAQTLAPIFNANINIVATTESDVSDVTGKYVMGLATPGTYTLQVGAVGYESQTITGVNLSAGVTTLLDVYLNPLVPIHASGTVTDSLGNPINGATVLVYNDSVSYTISTNAAGTYTIFPIYTGTYTVIASQWGYISQSINSTNINFSDSTVSNIILAQGFYDDFSTNYAWTSTAIADGSGTSSGNWVLGEPIGTDNAGEMCNPEEDVNFDFGDQCYITGNAGGAAGNDDCDNGSYILVSPVMDLSNYNDARLSFSTWFYNAGGVGGGWNDTLSVDISNGTSTVRLYSCYDGMSDEGTWSSHTYKINDFISVSNNMTLIVTCTDYDAGHLVEGGFDALLIVDSAATGVNIHEENFAPHISVYPQPASDCLYSSIDLQGVINIYSIDGQWICNKYVQGNKIDISQLAKGTYLFTYTQNNKTNYTKFVKL